MKKVLVKILTLVLSFTSLFAISLFVGCDCSSGPGSNVIQKPQEEVVRTLTLDANSLTLIVGDEHSFTATYKKEEGKSLTFASSNSNIAEVTSAGKLVANNEGTTKITATYGDLTAECDVTVSFGNFLPELTFEGGILDVYDIGLDGKAYEFAPAIKFNGKLFYDVDATFVSADESVVKFNNAEATALKLGKTTATITASWRGFTIDKVPALQKVINLETTNVVNFLINGEACSTLELSTYNGTFAGQEYVNWSTFKPSIMLNGEMVKNAVANIEVADTDIVDYEDGKVTSKEQGATTIKLTYFDSSSNEYNTTINVNVVRPIADSGRKFSYFSSVTGYFKDIYDDFANKSVLKVIYGSRLGLVTDAYVVGTNQPLTIDGDKILGLPVNKESSILNEIVIGTKTYAYTCELDTYSVVVADKEDLALFDVHYTDSTKTAMSYIDGYCEVVRNIDATGFKLSHTGVQTSNATHPFTSKGNGGLFPFKAGFRGVFDGKGFVIFNLDTGRNVVYNNINGVDQTDTTGVGLFGLLQGTYVVRNIAFENMKVDKGNGISYNAVSSVSLNDVVESGNGTFENIYISLSADSKAPQGLLFKSCYGGRYNLTNFVVSAPNLVYDPEYAGQYQSSGFIDANGSSVEKGDGKKISDVIVISKHPVSKMSYYQVYGENEIIYHDGKDVTEEIALNRALGYKTTEKYPKYRRVSNIKRYDSIEDMSKATATELNLSNFPTTYWQVETEGSGKVIYWKSLMGYSFDLYDENEEIFDSVLFDKEGSSKSFTIKNSFETITNYDVTVSDSSVLEVKNGKIILKNYKVGYYEVTLKFTNSAGSIITRVIPVTVDALNVESYLQEDGEIVMHGLDALPAGAEFSINGVTIAHEFTGGKLKVDLSNVDLSSVDYTDIVDVYVKTDSGKDIKFKASYVSLAIDEASDLTYFNVGYTFDQTEFDAITDETEKVKYLENAQKNPYDYYDGYYVLTQNIDADGVTFNHEAVFIVSEANAAKIGWTYDEATDTFTDNNSSAITYGGVNYIIPREGYPVTTETKDGSFGPAAFRYKIGLRGTFDGQGYVIDNLKGWRQNPTFTGKDASTVKPTNFGAGLFGVTNSGSVIKNVAVTNVNIAGKISGESQYGTTFALIDIAVSKVLGTTPTNNRDAGPNDAFETAERTLYENIYVHSDTTQVYGLFYIYAAANTGASYNNVVINLPKLTSAEYNSLFSAVVGGNIAYTQTNSSFRVEAKNLYVAHNTYALDLVTEKTVKGELVQLTHIDLTKGATMDDLYAATTNYRGVSKTMAETFANNPYFEVFSRGDSYGIVYKGLGMDTSLTVFDADGNEVDEIALAANAKSQVISVKDVLGACDYSEVNVDFGSNAGNLVYDSATGEIKVDGTYVSNEDGYEVTLSTTIIKGNGTVTASKVIKVICNPETVEGYLSVDDAEIVGHGLTEVFATENYSYVIDGVDVTGSIDGTKILLANLDNATLPSEMPGKVTVKVVSNATNKTQLIFDLTCVSLAIDEASDLAKFNVGYTYNEADYNAAADKAAYLAACEANPYDFMTVTMF